MKKTLNVVLLLILCACFIYVGLVVAAMFPQNDYGSVAVLLIAYGAFQQLTVNLVLNQRFKAELFRKVLHVGNGLLWAFLPWLFSNPWPPTGIALVGALWFFSLRISTRLRELFGKSIHTAKRISSYGEVAFSWGFVLLFHITGDDALAYVVPAMILTLSDAFAALVGVAYGRRTLRCPDGEKTVEGAFAFFVTALPCLYMGLAYSFSPGISVVLSVVIAMALTLVELLSWKGLDNLAIPIVAWWLLSLAQKLPIHDVLAVAMGITLVMIWTLNAVNVTHGNGRAQ